MEHIGKTCRSGHMVGAAFVLGVSMDNCFSFTRFLRAAGMLLALVFAGLPVIDGGALAVEKNELQAEVANLKLGLGAYTLATRLTDDQVAFAARNGINKAYQGTYKFQDGDIFVVVDKSNDTILALYKKQDKAVKDQMKAMVSELMGTFGEPTAMAHEQMIYWVYNRQGKIDDEVYNKARKEGTTAELGIIASVKFSSSVDISPDSRVKSTDGPQDKEPTRSTIYFILTSDPLVKGFMGTNPSS